jgi:hypothetical protein
VSIRLRTWNVVPSAFTVSVARGVIVSLMPSMVIASKPVSPSDCRVSPFTNSSGITPIPTRLERWMRSKLSAITARTPRSIVPLAAQSRDEPVPYSLPAMITSGVPPFWYSTEAS